MINYQGGNVGALNASCDNALKWYYALAEQCGKRHSINQDTLGAVVRRDQNSLTKWLIACVCDGVGGGAFPDVASRELVDYCLATPTKALESKELLIAYLAKADQYIYELLQKKSTAAGATMLAAAWINLETGEGFLSRVGDSQVRRLSITNSKFLQFEDQTFATSPDEMALSANALFHPVRMIGCGAMGPPEVKEIKEADALKDDEVLLLCTDGIGAYIDEINFLVMLEQSRLKEGGYDFKNYMHLLFKEAIKNGSDDDMSAFVLQCKRNRGG